MPMAGGGTAGPSPGGGANLENIMRNIDHFIGGAALASGERQGDVFDPNTGEVQARVALRHRRRPRRGGRGGARSRAAGLGGDQPAAPRAGDVRVQAAGRGATWTSWPQLLSSEHGKVIADSRGDVQRGLEVIEFACGIPHALKGEYTEGAGPGIDVYSMRQPLGVVAGITPFNFPAMIPMWMFGVAIACGNAFILKPSEKDPSVPVRLAELIMEAGAPDGRAQRRPRRQGRGRRHPRPTR